MTTSGKEALATKLPEEVIEAEVLSVTSLGPIGLRPDLMVKEATAMANALAGIINSQHLFSIINGKKYVLCEGWTTLGAMLGVVTVEDYVKDIPNGYEAKVKLIRARDAGIVGGASAICTTDEPIWKTRQPYAVRSMALTRATSKAFRLAYAWIMKLAGFEPTPAEEMVGTGEGWGESGSKEAAQEVGKRIIREKTEAIAATGKKLALSFVPGDAGMTYLEGDTAKAALKGYLTVEEDALIIWLPKAQKHAIPNDQIERFFGLCDKAGIEPKIVPAAPGAVPTPSVAAPTKTPLEVKLENSLPTIRSTEKITTRKQQEYLKVQFGTKDVANSLSCWDKPMWPYLEHGVGMTADFHIVKKGDYQNIVGIKRIGEQTFSQNQDGKWLPDIQVDEPPPITDADLPEMMFGA